MNLLDRLRGTEQPRYLWAALVTIGLLWSPAYAAPKGCGDRSEIQAYLETYLQQRKVGFTVSSPAGRLELWTTKPIETSPGIFVAERWSGLTITSKETCIEVEGTGWIFMSWELG